MPLCESDGPSVAPYRAVLHAPCQYGCKHSKNGKRMEREAHLRAYHLHPSVWEGLIARGFRRSGNYMYRADMKRTCCPTYSAKTDALEFVPRRRQRKALYRWSRYVQYGEDLTEVLGGKHLNLPPAASLSSMMEELNGDQADWAHKFKVVIEPPSLTPEKVKLYQDYHAVVHGSKMTSDDFYRTMVMSPLATPKISYPDDFLPPKHFPENYGVHHLMYRLDGKLIAMGLVDILPQGIASTFFIYDKTFERYSLGKLGLLQEISLVQEMARAQLPMRYVYSGYYVHSCSKMKYKLDWKPVYLADSDTGTWYPADSVIHFLDKYRYACLSDPERSISEFADDEYDYDFAHNSPVVVGIPAITGKTTLVSAKQCDEWNNPEARERLIRCVNALGPVLSSKVIFRMDFDPRESCDPK